MEDLEECVHMHMSLLSKSRQVVKLFEPKLAGVNVDVNRAWPANLNENAITLTNDRRRPHFQPSNEICMI